MRFCSPHVWPPFIAGKVGFKKWYMLSLSNKRTDTSYF